MPVSSAMNRIEPQSGTAFRLRTGETLLVRDPSGEQVADLFCYAANDCAEALSSGRSLDYAETIYLSTGNVLYSNRSRPMLKIERDSVGRHDFLLTPCSLQTFAILYRHEGPHPSCFDNLARAFEAFGIAPDTIATTFNIFMNTAVGPDGRIFVLPPKSAAGDEIVFQAEMDLIVGLTACSAEMSNNYAFKPIDWTIEGARSD